MARRITPKQRAVIDRMKEIGHPVRPIEVVSTATGPSAVVGLPRTESTARGILAALVRKEVVERHSTKPATFSLNEGLPTI